MGEYIFRIDLAFQQIFILVIKNLITGVVSFYKAMNLTHAASAYKQETKWVFSLE
jgi:hypothetical protein